MKKLPIGTDNFTKLIDEEFYYVDKTGLIRDLMNNWAEVNLFTRPRRFGKSLNMSMLQAFFDINGRSDLFNNLIISDYSDLCEKYQNKYPVIYITLKDVDGDSYSSVARAISNVIGMEARRFSELKDSKFLLPEEQKAYEQLIINADVGEASTIQLKDEVLKSSLLTLSNLLAKHYKSKVIILVDEYDVPLDKANGKKHYDKVVELIRGILSRVLKSNDDLQFAVLTGCLRVAKESIFTGLNNLHIMSIQDPMYDEYFGFVESEVYDLLKYYGLEDRKGTIDEWYDGYMFGKKKVYCPWDVLEYCFDAKAGWSGEPKTYWANVSGNSIVRRLLENANVTIKSEIESLLEGSSINKKLNNNLTYQEIYDTPENIWSVLFSTGYLTMVDTPRGEYTELKIPNLEVRTIFINQIKEWTNSLSNEIEANKLSELFFEGADFEVKEYINMFLKQTISIRDTYVKNARKENFYHGILLGLLGHNSNIVLRSNVESGEGYGDIIAFDSLNSRGFIIEVKYAHDRDLVSACKDGLKQIDKKNYSEYLIERNCKQIKKYSISCYMKECEVMIAT